MAGTQTKVCLLTPPGEGGIAIIALWGPGAPAMMEKVFHGTRRAARELKRGRLAHGTIRRDTDILDEVILAHLPPPYPDTEHPYFEVNCHGGAAAVRAVMDLLMAHGAQASEVSDGREALPVLSPERIRRDALAALRRVPTQLGALVLLHQANGALATALDAIRERLEAGAGDQAIELLNDLQARWALGRALLTPPRVALLGPPNAGKSTLLNALLEEERVIVHHEPGTTRDVIVERVAIRGVPFDLMDSAGIRDTADAIEAEAVRRATRLAAECDVALLVFDASAVREPEPGAFPRTSPGTRIVPVASKIDLLEGEAPPAAVQGQPVVAVSALESRGLGALEDALVAPYAGLAEPCRAGAAVMFAQEQGQVVREVRAALEDGGCGPALQVLRAAGVGADESEPEAGHDQVEQRAGRESHEEHDD